MAKYNGSEDSGRPSFQPTLILHNKARFTLELCVVSYVSIATLQAATPQLSFYVAAMSYVLLSLERILLQDPDPLII